MYLLLDSYNELITKEGGRKYRDALVQLQLEKIRVQVSRYQIDFVTLDHTVMDSSSVKPLYGIGAKETERFRRNKMNLLLVKNSTDIELLVQSCFLILI